MNSNKTKNLKEQDIFELMRTEEGRRAFQEENIRRVNLIEEDRKKYGFYYPENVDYSER